MITVEYGLATYENFLKQFSKALKVKYTKSILNIPSKFGNGFFRLISFPGGIECLVFNAYLKIDMQFHQKKIKEEHLIIRLDDKTPAEEIGFPLELQLNKTNRKWFYMVQKNQTISGINILFKKDAMNEFFGDSEAGIQINNHLNILTSLYYNEPLDAEYKKYTHDILNAGENEFSKFIIYNRLLLIRERVFRRFYKKVSGIALSSSFSNDDVLRVKEAEAKFIKEFSEQPLPINQLSKQAAMSVSKFKIIFKEIYGLPPHQYYQKQRMNKARAMILSGNYTLNEILEDLGFEKISFFKSAYEKAFGMLPEIPT